MSDHNRLIEQKGVHYVGFLAAKYGCLYRNVTEHDKGVDAEIELTQSLGVASSRLGVQVKARSAFKPTSDNKIAIYVTEQNLHYWKSYGCPVVLMAYCDADTEVYWTRVDNASSPKIKISLAQKFDHSVVQNFAQIISQYHANLARNLSTKDVSEILSKLSPTIDEVLKPVEQKLKAANALFWDKKYREAAQIYEPLFLIYEENQFLRYNLLLCLLVSGEHDRVIDIVTETLRKSPDESDYYNLLAAGLELAGREQEAESAILEAIKRKITSAESWNNLGLLHWRQGRNQEAYEDLCQAVIYTSNNDKDDIYLNLALCSITLEKYTEAIYYYDECIKLNPNHYDAFNNKGILLTSLLRVEEALESYESAIKINSKNPCALCNSASLLKDLGYDERAIQRYHMLLEERPDDGCIHLNLGVLYCRIDDWSTAAYHFDKSYKFIRSDSSRGDFKQTIPVIDIGYEVCHWILIEFTKHSVRIIRVDAKANFALFNMPLMREWVQQAHIKNKPLPPEDPRKLFAPKQLSSSDLCKSLDPTLRRIEGKGERDKET